MKKPTWYVLLALCAASFMGCGTDTLTNSSPTSESPIVICEVLAPGGGCGTDICGDDICGASETCSSCSYDCGSCPPPPPSTPGYMTYTPFSESLSITIAWPATSGATYYALDRSTNGSSFTQVYAGSATSVQVAVPGDGAYRYRIRACNSGGCSSYRTDETMRISQGPNRTGSGGLATLAAEKGRKGTTDVEEASISITGGTPWLAGGFDQLRQELTSNNCLDTTNMQVISLPGAGKNYFYSIVNSREELASSLELTQNLSVSAKYGKFSASYSGTKSFLSESTRIEQTSMLMISLSDKFREETIANRFDLPFLPARENLLLSGNGAAFRNQCGDGFVHSITYGRQAYVAVQMKSLDYSESTIRQQTQNLKADIGTWASGGYSSTQKSTITQKYSSYRVEARVISLGSSVPVSSVVDLATAMSYIQAFEAEPQTSGVPIRYDVTDYTRPASVPVNLWPDYHPYQTTLQRWYRWDNQLAEHCLFFDDNLNSLVSQMDADARTFTGGLSLRVACFYLKGAVLQNIQNCEDTTKWGQCIQPDSGSCSVNDGSGPANCLTYANRIPYWNSTTSSLSLDGDLGTGLSSKSETISRTSPALAAGSILDRRIGNVVDCSGQGGCPSSLPGVNVTTTELVNGHDGSNSWNASTRVLSASVTLCRPGLWKGGARIHQLQVVNGLAPNLRPYLF